MTECAKEKLDTAVVPYQIPITRRDQRLIRAVLDHGLCRTHDRRVPFSSVQNVIYALGKANTIFSPSLTSFVTVAFDTVLKLV